MRLASRLVTFLVIVFAEPAGALTISFTKIADEASNPAWNAYAEFGTPAVDAGVVTFFAVGGDPYLAGVYTGSGGALTTVADSNTPVPGSSQPFGLVDSWGSPTISEGNVAFMANEGGFGSVFASLDGTLTRIAADDGSGNLSIDYMRSPMIDGRNVAFRAWDGQQYAVLTSVDGVLETSASRETELPGSPGGIDYIGPSFASGGTSVAFQGGDGVGTGIYVATADTARVVADTLTTVPGESILFAGFESGVAFDAGNVAFLGASTLSSDPLVILYGLYAEIGGMLIRVADSQTLIPGSSETFDGFTTQFQDLSISGETVAFYGGASLGPNGIYVYRDGELHKVIEVGDLLDGRSVVSLRFGPRGLSGDQLAFSVLLDDDSGGVYLVTIPEPGTALLLAAGLLALGAGRRAARRPR